VSHAAALEALGVGAVLDHVADPLAVVAGHVVHLTLLAESHSYYVNKETAASLKGLCL